MKSGMFQGAEERKERDLTEIGQFQPVLLAMGANLASVAGVPEVTIKESLRELSEAGIEVLEVSKLYRTPAFPTGSGPDFVNAAVLCRTKMSPTEIIQNLHRIEEKFGRERKDRWSARTIDIDLLAVGVLVCPDIETHKIWRSLSLTEQQKQVPDGLILPHPRMQERAFVLRPLADVAPDWQHPILGQTVLEMLEALPNDDLKGIEPL